MAIRLIVAVDKSNAIGWADGRLPWRIPADLKRFKELTTGSTVVMGFNTFASLNRPAGLPNRENVVLTNKTKAEFLAATKSEEMAVRIEKSLDWVANSQDDVWIIGGATIYKQALDLGFVDEIYLTLVNDESNGDVKFPVNLHNIEQFLEAQAQVGVKWILTGMEEYLNNIPPFSFIILKRR